MEELKYQINLIKANLYFLINKKNIILIILLNFLLFIYSIYQSSIFDGMSKLDSYRSYYLSNYISGFFTTYRIFYISFIIFINISYSTKEYESYSELIVKNVKTKINFYLVKYVSTFLVYLMETIFSFLLFESILLVLPYGKYYISFLKPFLNMYLIGLIYSLISSIFILVFKTYQASMLSLIMYLFSFIYCSFYSSEGIIKNIIILIFPYGSGDLIVLDFGIIYIILYILILSLLNAILIIKKETL